MPSIRTRFAYRAALAGMAGLTVVQPAVPVLGFHREVDEHLIELFMGPMPSSQPPAMMFSAAMPSAPLDIRWG